jgi:hypothetical protein
MVADGDLVVLYAAGVTWLRQANRWEVRISSDGRKLLVGSYEDEEEAARAYDDAARRLVGERAALNFPTPEDWCYSNPPSDAHEATSTSLLSEPETPGAPSAPASAGAAATTTAWAETEADETTFANRHDDEEWCVQTLVVRESGVLAGLVDGMMVVVRRSSDDEEGLVFAKMPGQELHDEEEADDDEISDDDAGEDYSGSRAGRARTSRYRGRFGAAGSGCVGVGAQGVVRLFLAQAWCGR